MSMKVKTEKQYRKINQAKICPEVELSYGGISKVGRNIKRQISSSSTGKSKNQMIWAKVLIAT